MTQVEKQKLKSEQTRQNQDAIGIPESPILREPPKGEADSILSCHINGVLIKDLNLEPHVIAVLNRALTDEGMAERNANPNRGETSGIQVQPPREDRRWIAETTSTPGHFEYLMRSTDEFGKALDQRRDDVNDRDMDSYSARDPFREVADTFTTPGMRPKFLSSTAIAEGGTRDHRIVKYPEGHPHVGDPVKVRGMVLGEMPERKAIARNKHYAAKGADLLKQVQGKHKADGGTVD